MVCVKGRNRQSLAIAKIKAIAAKFKGDALNEKCFMVIDKLLKAGSGFTSYKIYCIVDFSSFPSCIVRIIFNQSPNLPFGESCRS